MTHVHASRYLEEIGACSLSTQPARPGRTIQAGRTIQVDATLTFYGELLANLGLPVEAAQVVLAGGSVGLLWPSAIIAGIMATTPQPILRPFGRAETARCNVLFQRFGCTTSVAQVRARDASPSTAWRPILATAFAL